LVKKEAILAWRLTFTESVLARESKRPPDFARRPFFMV